MSFTFERFEDDDDGGRPQLGHGARGPSGAPYAQNPDADADANARLPPLVLTLLDSIQPAGLQRLVAGVFDGVSRILDRLTLIQSVLSSDEPPQAAAPLFHLLHEAAHSLLTHLEAEAVRADGVSDKLADTLDGACFAVRHELRRVFEQELLVVDAGQTAQQMLTEMLRAHSLLLNCFQQTYVAVAQVFDQRMTASDLFSDVRLRREQSVTLYRHLLALLGLVRRAEEEKGLRSYLALCKGLKVFAADHMQFLMYRDWEEFEGFVGRITGTRNAVELRPLLHQFRSYLEALIGHVRMRAAFLDEPTRD